MAVTNPYYEFDPVFVVGAKARAGEINTRLGAAIQTAFDILPGDADAMLTDTAIFAPESGAANAYVVTMPDTRTANTDGDGVIFFSTHTNTGAATLDIDSIGAIAIVNWDGTVLTGSEIVSGRLYECRYDGDNTQYVLAATTDGALQVTYAEEWATQVEDTLITAAAGGDAATDYSALHWAAKAAASAVAGVINTDINTATPPTTEAVTGAHELWDADTSDLLARMGYVASNVLQIKNLMHGGAITLTGEDDAGSEQTLISSDPDGATELYREGTKTAQTVTAALGGMQVDNQVTGAGLERVLTISDITAGGAALAAKYLFDTSTSEADPGVGDFRMDNATPASVTKLFISTTTTNSNDFDNILGLVTAGDQIYVQQDDDSAKFVLFDVTANVDNTGWYTVTGTIASSGTIFDSANQCTILILFGGAGAGQNNPFTTPLGVIGDINTATPPTTEAITALLQYQDLAGDDVIATIGFNANNDLLIANNMREGRVILQAEDTGGVTRTAFVGDPDGVAEMYNLGVSTITTLAAASGGAQVNNTSTGGGFERVLTLADFTAADESTDTTCFPAFFTAATGVLLPKTGTNLTFNSSSGLLTATLLAGGGASITALNMANASAGTLAVARGGTGVTSSTGTGSTVRSITPAFTGTPTFVDVVITDEASISTVNIGNSIDCTIGRQAAGIVHIESRVVFTHNSTSLNSGKIHYATTAATGGAAGDLFFQHAA